MKKIKDKLKVVSIDDITPYAKNAKRHTRAQIELIIKSIEKNDYYSPIGVDSKNIVVFGHGRLEALRLMGVDKVEVVDLSYLKPRDIRKLRILDNKVVSTSYDRDLLEAEIESIYQNVEEAIELGISKKEIDEWMGEDEIKPSVEFTEELLEEHNYVVLYFDNEVDWLQLETILDLKTVKALHSKKGGFATVKAMAAEIPRKKITQIGMSITDFEKTPLYRIFEVIKLEAARYNVPIVGSEFCGMTPLKSLIDIAAYYLKIDNLNEDRVMEIAVQRAVEKGEHSG